MSRAVTARRNGFPGPAGIGVATASIVKSPCLRAYQVRNAAGDALRQILTELARDIGGKEFVYRVPDDLLSRHSVQPQGRRVNLVILETTILTARQDRVAFGRMRVKRLHVHQFRGALFNPALERLVQLAQLFLCIVGFRDVEALDENSGDLVVVAEDRLIDEVQVPRFGGLASG